MRPTHQFEITIHVGAILYGCPTRYGIRSASGAISANYATTDGSDYTQTTGTDSEGTETFTITLTSPISGENLDHAS
ncbi:hypothetical protein PN36_32085 [Candidatus Thiomargarita nelsonii]|uniref:Uncharacterized protein n=1 Tax=Candidatus Thiomargarita nelsonii TaxID=1003181 RepID=A0A4E0QQG2_9GAMM|nr:hypothetical protein PN36_32085 [Candidatus Thiomargarita nelsonii]